MVPPDTANGSREKVTEPVTSRPRGKFLFQIFSNTDFGFDLGKIARKDDKPGDKS
jgi:hypothetical protein